MYVYICIYMYMYIYMYIYIYTYTIQITKSLQICSHGGWPMDPDSRDNAPPGVYLADEMNLFVRQHFPGLEDKPSIIERCMYTVRDLPYLCLSNQ